MILERLGWEPSTSLAAGLERTYAWIHDELARTRRRRPRGRSDRLRCAPPRDGTATTVISLILYGRNDAHGYNLHRRAALSLNCMAEVLTDPDDEIIFVDYNTPDELPTFVEAIADTLTDRCLDALRVLRVPAVAPSRAVSAAGHTSRRSSRSRGTRPCAARIPANRWLLSTNTDMVLAAAHDESLSDICAPISRMRYYGLPALRAARMALGAPPANDPAARIAELGA